MAKGSYVCGLVENLLRNTHKYFGGGVNFSLCLEKSKTRKTQDGTIRESWGGKNETLNQRFAPFFYQLEDSQLMKVYQELQDVFLKKNKRSTPAPKEIASE
jgi:hypothetical protein